MKQKGYKVYGCTEECYKVYGWIGDRVYVWFEDVDFHTPDDEETFHLDEEEIADKVFALKQKKWIKTKKLKVLWSRQLYC